MNYLIKEKIKKIDNKYFKELPNKSHIDRRFGKPNLKFTKNFIINNLYFLLKKLSDICKENDIKLVIAHGTLIGHYFNKKVLPWDDDIDVVLVGESIQKFIKLNTKKLSNQYFLLDINPNLMYSVLKTPENVTKSRMVQSVRAKCIGIKQVMTCFNEKELISCLVEGFKKTLNVEVEKDNFSEYEIDLAKKFIDEKYKNEKWLKLYE